MMCNRSDPVKWSRCLCPKLCKVKQRRGWGCNFTRRTLLLLVVTLATIMLIYTSHTWALIFIARRRGEKRESLSMERRGVEICLYVLCFMRNIDHSSLTRSTEMFWAVLLKREEVMAVSFSSMFYSFYWINSHHFPAHLFMWWGFQGGQSCSLCIIPSAPGASDRRWVLSANRNGLSASRWFYL